MTKRNKKDQINLLPQLGMKASISGRVVLWVLSSFRIVVIVTEIIVMIAFLSRFWLDAQNTDLNEEITQKVAVLQATQNSERQFRDHQNRLSIYSNIKSVSLGADKSLEHISVSIPSDVVLKSFKVEGSEIIIQGTSTSERSIQQYMANLASFERFTETKLISLSGERDVPSILEFRIQITTKS